MAVRADKVVSFGTQRARWHDHVQFINDLHDHGMKVTSVHHLGSRHLRCVVPLWEARGLAAATLQRKFSNLRTLYRWIGEGDVLRNAREFLCDRGRYERSCVATEDKSWDRPDVNRDQRLRDVEDADPIVALQLRLQDAFGLRTEEAAQLRPHLADRGS